MSNRRPYTVPLFGTNPMAGALVEPVEVVRKLGFATDDRPPAQWFNWLLASLGQWADFNRGPNSNQWQRYTMTLADIVSVDADPTTAETDTILRRIVGVDALTSAKVYASRRGDSWVELDVNLASGTVGVPNVALWGGGRWLIGTDDSGTGRVFWTWADGNPSSSPNASAINNDTNNWNVSTMPGGFNAVVAMATDLGSHVVVVSNTAQLGYSSTNGTSFSAGTLSPAPSGGDVFVDVIYTGSRWVATGNDGATVAFFYTADTVNGTWTKNATTAGSPYNWLLASDGEGTVIAVPKDLPTTPAWYISTDHGVTWTTMTAPAFKHITAIHYIDGAYFITSTSAPYVATANQPAATEWLRLRMPFYADGDNHTLHALVESEGALVACGVGYVFVCDRAQDEAPASWSPTSMPAPLHDAAYLRGNPVATATPANGDLLVWDGTAGEWIVETWSMTTTARDAIVSPRTGRVIFNTTTSHLNFYDGAAWRVVTST